MSAKTEPRTVAKKTANVGRCGGMHCVCGGFVRGREVAGWLICAGCGHTQQVHARIESGGDPS